MICYYIPWWDSTIANGEFSDLLELLACNLLQWLFFKSSAFTFSVISKNNKTKVFYVSMNLSRPNTFFVDLVFSCLSTFCGLIEHVQNQIFRYRRRFTSIRKTTIRDPSPRHCALATQLLSRKCCSGGEALPTLCQIWPTRDLNLTLPAPETNALSLYQLCGRVLLTLVGYAMSAGLRFDSRLCCLSELKCKLNLQCLIIHVITTVSFKNGPEK